jgi:hypothetical protein
VVKSTNYFVRAKRLDAKLFMGKPPSILRCGCTRCAIERRDRFFLILLICTALAAGSKLLVQEHAYFLAAHPSSSSRDSAKIANGEVEFSADDRSPETIFLRTSRSFANSYPSEAKPSLPDPCLSRERFNAALAAGLIDPSRIELAESADPKLSLTRERSLSQTWTPLMIPMIAQGTELQALAVKVATATPMTSAPSKTTEAIQRLGTPISKIAFISSNPASKAEAATPRRPDASRPTDKHFSVGFISKAGDSSAEVSSSEESKSRRSSPVAEANPASPATLKTDDRSSPPRNLTENLQRFASDFVRANQDDNFAEQHRFFAESVHFYGEGDLSLASVEAATRRYRREQLSKRSEVAEPAAATGPVNGGFFVIEQPVRWTQSQGTKVKQGRSVLRLRVVPINHGGWKITSIDEVGR